MDADDETPVPFGTLRPTERRALIGCAFAAGCICLMPQQLAAAAIAFGVSGILAAWHLRKTRAERAAEEKAEAEAAARGETEPAGESR